MSDGQAAPAAAPTGPSGSSDGQTSPQDGNKEPVVVERVNSTGNRWKDYQLALQRIRPKEDLQNIGTIPCARNSLLAGIASGVGIGVIRALNARLFVATNWAVATFAIVSIGTWEVCNASIRRERQRVQVVVEEMAARRLKVKPPADGASELNVDRKPAA